MQSPPDMTGRAGIVRVSESIPVVQAAERLGGAHECRSRLRLGSGRELEVRKPGPQGLGF